MTEEKQTASRATCTDDYHWYCGNCGCRIPLKIKAHYCHKCGTEIDWITRKEKRNAQFNTGKIEENN